MVRVDKKSALVIAQGVVTNFQLPSFFKDTEFARATLMVIFDSVFPGTESCRTFLLEYDIRGVGYAKGDFYQDTSPAEWLEQMGIAPAKGQVGIFDPEFVREFEKRKLRLYVGMDARHPMVGVGVPNREADIKRWEKLLREWEREYKNQYGVHFNAC